ncbi:MAG: hypothetical protein HY908_35895 [Myxococcales bacterium]|nr:hypothetical protein [Myxococcales bacterium]
MYLPRRPPPRAALRLAAVASSGALSLASACTALLGDDYELASGGGTGGAAGAGTGGATSSAGSGGTGGTAGAGGSGVAPYECAWDPTRFRTIQTLEAAVMGARLWQGGVRAFALGDRLRVFATRWTGISLVSEVHTVAADGTVSSFSFGADAVLDAVRLGSAAVGVLHTRTLLASSQIEIDLRVVRDADSALNTTTLSPLAVLPNSNAIAHGTFTSVAGGAPDEVAFAVSGPDATGQKVLFGVSTGGPVTPAQLSEYDGALPEAAFVPTDVARAPTGNHVFVGAPAAAASTRQYLVPDAGASPAPPAQIYAPGLYPLAMLPSAATQAVNAAFLDAGGPAPRLLAGRVDPAALASFDPTLLAVPLAFATSGDALERGKPRWQADDLFWAGRVKSTPTLLGLVIAHASGALRTEQTLAFPGGPSSYVAEAVDAAPNASFATLGGELWIVWRELHDDVVPPYEMLMAGVLECYPP